MKQTQQPGLVLEDQLHLLGKASFGFHLITHRHY